MNGPTLTRRILKARAKRTIARFSRPCIAAACLLLAFTVLARAFSVYAGGALYYLMPVSYTHLDVYKRQDLLMVASDSFIIVVMTDTNVVRNRLVRLPADLSEAQLQLLNTLLNTTFTGLTLDEITPELMRVASHAAGEAYGLSLIHICVPFRPAFWAGSRPHRPGRRF